MNEERKGSRLRAGGKGKRKEDDGKGRKGINKERREEKIGEISYQGEEREKRENKKEPGGR